MVAAIHHDRGGAEEHVGEEDQHTLTGALHSVLCMGVCVCRVYVYMMYMYAK